MKVDAITVVSPSLNPQVRYWSQDIMVNSTASVNVNQSYRDVNQPIHVEPAVKLQITPDTLNKLKQESQ